jgi:tRNA threonylcarbamoyl adenosine modification protein YeaZ
MKILALEFSTEHRSVAVLDGNTCVTATETGGRAAHAFDLIGRALAEAGLERERIECLAIGLGPGSYTGIRAAISIAQGWQLAVPVKLLGVSSADCLASQAQDRGRFGTVNIVIDAQRNEFYLARYELHPGSLKEIAPLKLASFAEVAALAKAGEMIVGPDVVKGFATGRVLFPEAAAVGRLVVGRNDSVNGEELAPIYLRETTFVKAPPPRVLPP